MKRLMERFNDNRCQWPDGMCIHCNRSLDDSNRSREHVPTRSLLRKPYPAELITMEACRDCNGSFSRDEQYLAVLLDAVLAGTADPDEQVTPSAAKRYKQNPLLRDRNEESRITGSNLFGEVETIFYPKIERVNRVVVKNARGHVLYELDIYVDDTPSNVVAVPLQNLAREQKDRFALNPIYERIFFDGWAEIGTRHFMRQCLSAADPKYSDVQGGWVIVQDGVYRFRVEVDECKIAVESVIHEYLTTQVIWKNEFT